MQLTWHLKECFHQTFSLFIARKYKRLFEIFQIFKWFKTYCVKIIGTFIWIEFIKYFYLIIYRFLLLQFNRKKTISMFISNSTDILIAKVGGLMFWVGIDVFLNRYSFTLFQNFLKTFSVSSSVIRVSYNASQ